MKGLLQFSKFVLVGLGNALVDLGVFNGLFLIQPTRDIYQLVAYNTLAVFAAITNSYIWNTRWTFIQHIRSKGRNRRQRWMFIVQSLVNVLMNDLVLWWIGPLVLASHLFPMVMANNLAKVTAMFIASMFSFVVMRYVVFI